MQRIRKMELTTVYSPEISISLRDTLFFLLTGYRHWHQSPPNWECALGPDVSLLMKKFSNSLTRNCG